MRYFLVHFRLIASRADMGPVWAVWGCSRSNGPSERYWAALGASVAGPGSLAGRLWAVLAARGIYVGALKAFVPGLGLLLEPLLAVQGRLWPISEPNPSGKPIRKATWPPRGSAPIAGIAGIDGMEANTPRAQSEFFL